MEWARILAHITGTANQELLLRNKYLVAEDWILKAQRRAAQGYVATGWADFCGTIIETRRELAVWLCFRRPVWLDLFQIGPVLPIIKDWFASAEQMLVRKPKHAATRAGTLKVPDSSRWRRPNLDAEGWLLGNAGNY